MIEDSIVDHANWKHPGQSRFRSTAASVAVVCTRQYAARTLSISQSSEQLNIHGYTGLSVETRAARHAATPRRGANQLKMLTCTHAPDTSSHT